MKNLSRHPCVKNPNEGHANFSNLIHKNRLDVCFKSDRIFAQNNQKVAQEYTIHY